MFGANVGCGSAHFLRSTDHSGGDNREHPGGPHGPASQRLSRRTSSIISTPDEAAMCVFLQHFWVPTAALARTRRLRLISAWEAGPAPTSRTDIRHSPAGLVGLHRGG
jgi:hypothetical protein